MFRHFILSLHVSPRNHPPALCEPANYYGGAEKTRVSILISDMYVITHLHNKSVLSLLQSLSPNFR